MYGKQAVDNPTNAGSTNDGPPASSILNQVLYLKIDLIYNEQ
ncbi:hypothetical protein [Acinetobacter baumannii]